jgi:hypothetical protein
MVVSGKANVSKLSQLVGVPAAASGANASQAIGIALAKHNARARERAACRRGGLRRGVLGCTAASRGFGAR